jgi:hypothetical protein
VNWKGYGRKYSWPNQGTVQHFVGRTKENQKKKLRIGSVSAEMNQVPPKHKEEALLLEPTRSA